MILDERGLEVRLKLGPYKLGDSVMIKCLVVGGCPSPKVSNESLPVSTSVKLDMTCEC